MTTRTREIDINAIIHVKPGFVTCRNDLTRWRRFEPNHRTLHGGVWVTVTKHNHNSNRVKVTLTTKEGKQEQHMPVLGYHVIDGMRLIQITKDEVHAAIERDKQRRIVEEATQRKAAMRLATEEV